MFKLYGRYNDYITKAILNYFDSEGIEYIFMTLAIEDNLKYLYDHGYYDIPVLFKNGTYIGTLGKDIPDLIDLKNVVEQWQDTD